MKECIFCKIIERKIPADILYEDDKTVAFLDITPVNKGHTLVIPKKHFVNIFDIPEQESTAVFNTVKKLVSAVKESVGAEGINIGNNNGPVAGQVVHHLHIHIMPRFSTDGHKLWKGKKYRDDAEMKSVAEQIKANIKKD